MADTNNSNPVPPLQEPDELVIPPAPTPDQAPVPDQPPVPDQDVSPDQEPPSPEPASDPSNENVGDSDSSGNGGDQEADQNPEPEPTPAPEPDYSDNPWDDNYGGGDQSPEPEPTPAPEPDQGGQPPEPIDDPYNLNGPPPTPNSDFGFDDVPPPSQSDMDDRFPPPMGDDEIPMDQGGPQPSPNDDMIVIDSPDANFDEIFGNNNPDIANNNNSSNSQDDYVPEETVENPDLPDTDLDGSETFNITPMAYNDFKDALENGEHSVKVSNYDSDSALKRKSTSYDAATLSQFVNEELDMDDDERKKLLDALDENTEYSDKHQKDLISGAAMVAIMKDFAISPNAPSRSSGLDQDTSSAGGGLGANNDPDAVPSTGASNPEDVAEQREKNEKNQDPNQRVAYGGPGGGSGGGEGKLSSRDSGRKAGDYISGLVKSPFQALGRGLRSRDGEASPERQASADIENVASIKSRLDDTYKNVSEMQFKDSLTNVEKYKLQNNLKDFAKLSKDNEDSIFNKDNYATEKDYKDTMKKFKKLDNSVESLKSDNKIDKSTYDEFKDGMKDFMKKVKEAIKKFTSSFSPS